ncbi:hypothetical protein [Methanobrevibacter arboriphilus]|nr:hypothetical protein [Methanobrevibacter arboriphilus]
MTTEVLFKFAKKNINLSPEAYYLINNLDDPLDFSSSLIVKLKSQEFSKEDLVSLKADIVEDFIKTLGLPIPNQNKDSNNPIPNSQKTLNNNENSKSNTNKLNTKLNTNKSNVNNLNTNKFNTKKNLKRTNPILRTLI